MESVIESLSIAHQFTAAYITRKKPDSLRNPATYGMLVSSFNSRAQSLIRRSSEKNLSSPFSLEAWASISNNPERNKGKDLHLRPSVE